MKYIKTTEKVEVKDYPYGFSLRTTLFDTIEFNPKKGYRHVTQTINPKNNRLNNPKKSTYYNFLIRFYDEKNHIKTTTIADFNQGVKGINKMAQWVYENFDLLSSEEIQYLYMNMLVYSRVSMQASVTYSGAKFEDLKPFFTDNIKVINEGISSKGTVNVFDKILFDAEGIEFVCVKDFNPFKVVSYGTV